MNKKLKKKIVAISGSFDILHAGHVRLLQQARALGDKLIVLLNSDRSIRMYKGPDRPIHSVHKRKAALAAIPSVDSIIVFNEITPIHALEKLKPDIYVNGSDWGKGIIESETVAAYGGKIVHLPLLPGYSTTNILKKLGKKDTAARAVFLDRDGTINDNKDGYIHTKEHFAFLPGVIEGIKKLVTAGYKIIIISNQSGIARRMYTKRHVQDLHDWLRQKIHVDAIYICPHGPESACVCRKPKPGMLIKAAKEHKLNLSKSWCIGDSDIDVIAGRSANAKTIKIGKRMQRLIQPHYYAKNFSEAVKHILHEKK